MNKLEKIKDEYVHSSYGHETGGIPFIDKAYAAGRTEALAEVRQWAREEMGVLDTPSFYVKNKDTAITYYDEALGHLLNHLNQMEKS